MAYLEVKNIKKYYGKVRALDGVSFKIAKGDILAVIGPSGNGKTTLLRCLNFLEKIDEGQIYLSGKLICEAGKNIGGAEMLKLQDRMGLVFQNFNLFPQYTVRKNIELALKLTMKRRNLQCDLIKETETILSKLNILDKANNYPFELSGGECQRVAIARAIVLKPDILCFDEPTSALDPKLVTDVAKLILEIKKNFNLTMIIVTHEMRFAKMVADKVMVLNRGKVEKFGLSEEIFQNKDM